MIVSQYLKARMEYRSDFIISFFGILFRDLTGLVGLWIIFQSIPAMAGWNFYEMVFLYSFSMLTLTPLQLFFDQVWVLRNHVVEGDFIKYYFRPLNMMFYYMSEVLDIKGFNQIVFAIVGLVYSSRHLDIVWTMPMVGLFVALFFTSSLVMISLMILAAVPAFWIMNPYAIIELVFHLRDFSRYPLTIFNSFFKYFFTCIIPIGFIAYYPVQFLLKPGTAGVAIYFSPIVGIGMFILAYLFWKKGVNSYSGTGS